MGNYITVTVSSDIRCSLNVGMLMIINYIGSNGKSNCSVSLKDNYKKGVEIINCRLHKMSKKAITRLVHTSKVINRTSTSYYQWKIHKAKACKTLMVIKSELSRINNNSNSAISSVYENIFKYLYQFYSGDIQNTRAEIMGRPYIRDLQNMIYDDDFANVHKDIATLLHQFNSL